MQNSALGPKVPGHIDQSGLCLCSSQTWLLLSSLWVELCPPPSWLCPPPHTPSTLLWLWGVALLFLWPLLQARRPCSVVDPLPERGSHSCVSRQRPRLLAVHEAEENQLTVHPSSLPMWEMCKEGSEEHGEQGRSWAETQEHKAEGRGGVWSASSRNGCSSYCCWGFKEALESDKKSDGGSTELHFLCESEGKKKR